MDIFSVIPFNSPKKDYSNFGEDMYGTSVKIPVHSYKSLYSKQPIYFTDYGSGGYTYPVYGRHGWRSPFYAKPPSGGIWAADGSVDKDAWVSECVKKKLDAIPAGTNFVVNPEIGFKADCEKEWDNKNSQSTSTATNKSERLLSSKASLAVTALGGVAGFLIANATKKDKLVGTFLGIAVASGGQSLINLFVSPPKWSAGN